jgi:hypothetical protein
MAVRLELCCERQQVVNLFMHAAHLPPALADAGDALTDAIKPDTLVITSLSRHIVALLNDGQYKFAVCRKSGASVASLPFSKFDRYGKIW